MPLNAKWKTAEEVAALIRSLPIGPHARAHHDATLAPLSPQVQQSASDLNATVVRTASQAAQSGTQLALGGGGLGGGLGGGGLNVMLQQVRELLMMTSVDL